MFENSSRTIQYTYPTPIYSVVAQGELLDKIQNEMSNILSKMKWSAPEIWGKSHTVSHDDFCEKHLENGNMPIFKEFLTNELETYCNNIDFSMRKFKTQSWFAKFEPGDYAHIHNHGYTDMSMCYYFKTNGEDGDLFFESPVNPAVSFCYKNFIERINQKPQIGKLLLFPGWLNHGVRRNETQNVRISFVANIFFER